MNRVVITGFGAVTAFGKDWPTVRARMLRYENAVRAMPEWRDVEDLSAKLAAPIDGYAPPAHWTRKQLRSLGPVSQMCVEAGERALADAGLLDDPSIRDGRMGVASGSSTGSTCDIYEAIRFGLIPMMLAGGGEELCHSEVCVFDSLYAASLKNDAPKTTPAPYDRDRDGLVIGEGAGMLVLESLASAQARGARIYAEIIGFASNCDGTHVTRPEQATMYRCMAMALEQAGIAPEAVGYVSGHGTATEQGDIAETQATARLFPRGVPLSSQKSYFGHTLGACGVLESWFAVEMMRDGLFMPTLNLRHVDERCGQVDFIRDEARAVDTEVVMNNNFAFGGVNTSLIFKRWRE